jgi:hypothetical protein
LLLNLHPVEGPRRYVIASEKLITPERRRRVEVARELARRRDDFIVVGLAKWPSFNSDMTDNFQEGDSKSGELFF